ncbi:MAG: hypothetical protein ACK5NU_12620, partial [Fusobacterium ulcerans]|uniref:hypothetical protein n=1 Tax=Fusobacterium ulcerans TaxID=861 RepID=UPI003A8360F2
MTNIEDNTDKRFQQLSKATGLTTQSAKDNTFKQASAFSEEFIKKFRESFPGIDVNIEVIVTSEEKKKSEYANKTGKNTESEDWLKYVVEKSATLGNQIFEVEAEISTLKSKAEELNEISFSKLVDSLYILDKENEKIETYTKQNYNIYKEMKGIEAKLNQREGLDNIGGESLTSGLDFVLGLTEAPSEENKNAETYLEKFEEAYKTGKDALEKAITFTKVVQGASIVAGAAGGALTGAAIIIVYGALWSKDHEVQNAKDWEKIVKENSTVDGQIAILEAIKADLGREKPVINPELLNNIIHLAQLKTMMEKVVANQYNEKLYKEGIADIDYYVDSLLINLKDTEKNQLRERSYAQENNDLGKLAFEGMYNDPKQEILPKLKDETNPMYRFITEYKQAIEEMYNSLTVNNQSEIPGSLIPCIQKTKEEIKELEKENIFETFLDNYERAMEKAPKVWDILGIDDEAKIKQEISKVQNLLTVDGTGVDTKENSEKLKVSSEEKEAAKKVAEMKREEENAMRNLVNVMNHFGNNLIAVGEGLNSSFLKNSGYTVNAFSSITDGFNLFKDNGGLSSITGMFKGGMAGSVKGLESITGALTSVSGIIAGVNVLSSLTSSLSGKDKKKKIEKSNEENKQAFENSTTTLLSFVEAIKANISAINSYSSTLLGYATNNTTLSGIAKVEKNFDLYIKAMVDGTKNFGTVTGLVKSKTKYKSWFKSKSADTYEAVEVKEADILKSMGITNTTIDNMDENQLRDFAEKLKTTG